MNKVSKQLSPKVKQLISILRTDLNMEYPMEYVAEQMNLSHAQVGGTITAAKIKYGIDININKVLEEGKRIPYYSLNK